MKLALFRRRVRQKTLVVRGLTWRVIDWSAPPGTPNLVMLPGTLGTAEIFWNQIAALQGEARILSVTYPILSDITQLADALAHLLDHCAIDKAHIVGSSLGGYLGQFFAARHPDRVVTLTIGNSLIDPSTGMPGGASLKMLEKMPAATHRDTILKGVRSWPASLPEFTRLQALLIESGSKLLTARALKARVLAVRGGGTVPRLSLSQKFIRIIDCADDPLLPRAVQISVRRRYPKAAYHRFPVGGHYPYVIKPDDYTSILRLQLAACSGSKPRMQKTRRATKDIS